MTFSHLLIPVVLLAASNSGAQTAAFPEVRQNRAAKQLFVGNKPFIMLAGELHNSSASSVEYMRPIWDKLAAMHVNTVIGTVSWELLEPAEGKFDFSLVDAQIGNARQRDMKLVLIWFATWKNAGSSYVPRWVKADRKRFPPMVLKVRPSNGMSSFLATYMEQQAVGPLSAHGEETMKADANAFRALMRHIKEVDSQHTVIMMQVENEAGSLGDSRDRSSLAEGAWTKPVPAALITYFVKHKAELLPEMQEVWGRNGHKTSGTWAEVFGNDAWSDEVFMAYHIGRFMEEVVRAGKSELNIPMYANAWLGPQPGQDLPSQYPSGGPVARVIDVYHAAAPSLDLIAPDIYVQDFKGTCSLYARSGNPLFMGIIYMTTSKLKGQGVSPCPSWPLFSLVSERPWTSVSDGSAALCLRSCLVPRGASCGEPPIRDPLSLGSVHEAIQPSRRVSRHVTIVEPKCELIHVPLKVLWAGVMVDAMQPALQDGPDTLDTVGVSRTTGVLASPVVDRLVRKEQAIQIAVRSVLIGVELRARFNRSMNLVLNRRQPGIGDDLRVNAPATFAHPEHGDFADRSAPGLQFFVLVFVGFFAADEALIDFDGTTQFVERAIRTAARFPQASQYEPCGLLRDADFFSELQAGNALARGDQQIHAVEPLVQGHLGPLHHRASPHGKVERASQAAVVSGLARGARAKGAYALSSAAIGAGWTGGPDPAFQVDPRRFFVGEQREKLKSTDSGAGHFSGPAYLAPTGAESLRERVCLYCLRPILSLPLYEALSAQRDADSSGRCLEPAPRHIPGKVSHICEAASYDGLLLGWTAAGVGPGIMTRASTIGARVVSFRHVDHAINQNARSVGEVQRIYQLGILKGELFSRHVDIGVEHLGAVQLGFCPSHCAVFREVDFVLDLEVKVRQILYAVQFGMHELRNSIQEFFEGCCCGLHVLIVDDYIGVVKYKMGVA